MRNLLQLVILDEKDKTINNITNYINLTCDALILFSHVMNKADNKSEAITIQPKQSMQ